jgi:hypothetical protein
MRCAVVVVLLGLGVLPACAADPPVGAPPAPTGAPGAPADVPARDEFRAAAEATTARSSYRLRSWAAAGGASPAPAECTSATPGGGPTPTDLAVDNRRPAVAVLGERPDEILGLITADASYFPASRLPAGTTARRPWVRVPGDTLGRPRPSADAPLRLTVQQSPLQTLVPDGTVVLLDRLRESARDATAGAGEPLDGQPTRRLHVTADTAAYVSGNGTGGGAGVSAEVIVDRDGLIRRIDLTIAFDGDKGPRLAIHNELSAFDAPLPPSLPDPPDAVELGELPGSLVAPLVLPAECQVPGGFQMSPSLGAQLIGRQACVRDEFVQLARDLTVDEVVARRVLDEARSSSRCSSDYPTPTLKPPPTDA